MYILLAALSAFFAGLVAVLSKIGLKGINSNLAMFIRTFVVLLFSFVVVFIFADVYEINSFTTNNWLFLALSGICTGASWLCYFKALKIGDINKVTPVDKSSVVLTVLISFLFLGEQVTPFKVVGIAGIIAGTFLMIERKKIMHRRIRTTVEFSSRLRIIKLSLNCGAPNLLRKRMLNKDIFIPIEKKQNFGWFIYAALSAVFAALVSVFAKIGMDGVNSNLATALRTVVVLAFSFFIVLLSKPNIKSLTKKNWLFLILSGAATGVSWLLFFRAVQIGELSVVSAIDKLGIVVAIVFSYFILKEKLTQKSLMGFIVLIVFTAVMILDNFIVF